MTVLKYSLLYKVDNMTKYMNTTNNTWEIGGKTLCSRLLIGSALYPSPASMEDAIKISGSEIVTVSLRRQAAGEGNGGEFWDIIKASFDLSFAAFNYIVIFLEGNTIYVYGLFAGIFLNILNQL